MRQNKAVNIMRKKTVKAVALALLAVMTVGLFSSCTTTQTGPQYKENADGYGLYRYESTSTETVLTVPDTYNGKPVTELQAFSVANAEYLKELNLGKNIKTIDVWALTKCPELERINVSEENPYFTSVDGVLYTKDMTELVAYPNGKTELETDKDGNVIGGGTLVLPDTVKVVRDNACYLCSNLYSVTLNEGLEKIGNMAFHKCTGLQEITLPNTVTEIGADAFSYCDGLKTVDIPSSVKKLGDYAFFSTASNIEKITVHQASADAIEAGEDWIPNKKDSINAKVPVEYVAD